MELSEALKTYIKHNIILSRVAVLTTVLCSLGYLLYFLVSLFCNGMSPDDTQIHVGNIIRILSTTAALYILNLNFHEISERQKPFSHSVIHRFRQMSVILIAAIPLSVTASFLTGILDPRALTSGFELSFADVIMLCFGAFVGMISRLFSYGEMLENELNMIA